MELFYYVLFICAFSNVFCDSGTCISGQQVVLENYQIYLIGFAMLFMIIVIICLSIALYMVQNNKTILGINFTKKLPYIRQESGHGVAICNYNNNSNDNRNNGSTFTVYCGADEVCGATQPESPKIIETTEEKKPPCLKKPIVPINPPITKAQMDELIKQVLLSNKHERGSEILRDLEAFTIQRTVKSDEKDSKRVSASLNDLDAINNENQDENLYENLPKTKQENKASVNSKLGKNTMKDSFKDLESNVLVEDEQEVYDTLPNPVKCPNTDLNDVYVENLPLYDCPPRKSWNRELSNSVITDLDSDYLLLLSDSGKQDNASYINAKPRDTH